MFLNASFRNVYILFFFFVQCSKLIICFHIVFPRIWVAFIVMFDISTRFNIFQLAKLLCIYSASNLIFEIVARYFSIDIHRKSLENLLFFKMYDLFIACYVHIFFHKCILFLRWNLLDYCFILICDQLFLFYFMYIFKNSFFFSFRLLSDYWFNLKDGKNSNMNWLSFMVKLHFICNYISYVFCFIGLLMIVVKQFIIKLYFS